jgi:hypothetical protein
MKGYGIYFLIHTMIMKLRINQHKPALSIKTLGEIALKKY